jgi:hypothetical protein
MSRRTTLLLSVAGAVTGLAAAAPVAPAQPPPQASCLGVLSSFAGQSGIRDEFAPPVSGARVAFIAGEHGDFNYCLTVFLTP